MQKFLYRIGARPQIRAQFPHRCCGQYAVLSYARLSESFSNEQVLSSFRSRMIKKKMSKSTVDYTTSVNTMNIFIHPLLLPRRTVSGPTNQQHRKKMLPCVPGFQGRETAYRKGISLISRSISIVSPLTWNWLVYEYSCA